MRKIKDVLRLKYEANLSCRQIAASLKLSVGVISKYTKAAEAAGLSWPLPDGMDDTTLEARLFPPATPAREHVMPDCARIHQELKRCWRRKKCDHLYRLNSDQATDCVAYYAAVDKSTRL